MTTLFDVIWIAYKKIVVYALSSVWDPLFNVDWNRFGVDRNTGMFFCEGCMKEVGVKTDISRVIISIYSFSWKCKQFGKQLVLIANGEKQQLPEEILLL